jgi:hydrogenase expression/formation protein HypC
MCLAIPSRIVEIDNAMAVIDVEGVRRQASLLLVEDAQVGDYVIVHAGFALRKLDPESARESIRLLREAAAMFPDAAAGAAPEPDGDPV